MRLSTTASRVKFPRSISTNDRGRGSMSAEVGITAVPSFVGRRVVVQEEAVNHRVGAARPEGTAQRSGPHGRRVLFPIGCVQNVPLACATPERIRNRWIAGMASGAHVSHVLRSVVSQSGVIAGGVSSVPQVTEASRAWWSRQRRSPRDANGVVEPHCARSNLDQWWQTRIARRVRSGPVVWAERGGGGPRLLFYSAICHPESR